MTLQELIQTDPGAFSKVLETPLGVAYSVSDLNRYVVQLQRTMPAAQEDGAVPTREVWTNSRCIVRELIGGPAPGEQLDIFDEAQAWSA